VHEVVWRFFGSLNDFLPRARRKRRFAVPLKASAVDAPLEGLPASGWQSSGQTIKDALEAIGVPHPEVAVMLVNGNPVDFAYELIPADVVGVYPHQEKLPAAPEWHMPFLPSGKPRFILDVHLGGLVRYMRLAGFDCLYSATDLGDPRLAELAEQESRVLLTRDVGLLKRGRVTWGYRPRNTQPKVQFREVVDYFRLRPHFDPFNRCSVCNSQNLVRLSREDALVHMPDGVPLEIEELWHCRQCGKIYWRGSHYDRIRDLIKSV
jgi:uncharacterized protein